MPTDSTPLGALLLKKRKNVLSRAENERLQSEVLGAARKLLLQYPETTKPNPPRSSAEMTLAGRVKGDDSHPLKLLVLDENAELLPRLRISVWLALHLHDHGKPEDLGEDLAEAFAPLRNPTGPNWTLEALENAVNCLSESLLAEFNIRGEDEFKWWQPDYLSVPFRRILGIDWQLSDVISTLQYYPGELITPSGRKIIVNRSIHTLPLPTEKLLSTCNQIKEQIGKGILSYWSLSATDVFKERVNKNDIFWYFYASVRSKIAQRYLFLIPKTGIHLISIIKNLTVDFLHRYLSPESSTERKDYDLELKNSLQKVADEALADLKKKYQDDPIVNSSNVVQRNYEKQLWWIESKDLPSLQTHMVPISNSEDEELSSVLMLIPPIEPWERRLAQDKRNRRDTNHRPVKPREVIDLYYNLLSRIRRKIERKILRQSLTDRYQASFKETHRVQRGHVNTETVLNLQHTLDISARNGGLEDIFELIRIRVDTLYIEHLTANNRFHAEEIYTRSGNDQKSYDNYAVASPIHPTIRSSDSEKQLKEICIWLVDDIRERVTSSEFEIICTYALELLNQN
jgi:hypothetical protein